MYKDLPKRGERVIIKDMLGFDKPYEVVVTSYRYILLPVDPVSNKPCNILGVINVSHDEARRMFCCD